MGKENQSYTVPVLPLSNFVLFPTLAMPLTIKRPASVKAVEAALASENKMISVFAQKDPTVVEPQAADIVTPGTAASIKLLARVDSTVQVVVYGLERINIISFIHTHPYLKAQVQPWPLVMLSDVATEALQRDVLELISKYFALSHPETKLNFPVSGTTPEDVQQLVYPVAKLLQLGADKEQLLLSAITNKQMLELFRGFLLHEIQIGEIRKNIFDKAQDKLSKEQRNYILREQLRAIQNELGEGAPESETGELRKKLEESSLPEAVMADVEKEISQLEKIPPASPEYHVTQSHLELILELPWDEATTDNLDLNNSRQILDEDHYDLKEVKERIVEQLAVMKLNPEANAPILCFVGPPGVGKTSLGQSIARSLGRKFEHFSLGGMHDEAELRGHRRTYIGAMPGRIIQAVRRAGVMNPLIMLDEIDKLGRDFRGDPAAALMEILDPTQNDSFRDNYLGLPFNLSKVFFITTANTLDTIPKPLLDRMEILRLSGYSDEEKMEIAHRYLFPRQRKDAGLLAEQFSVTDETITAIIQRYTREAGVRELERMLGRLARKIAVRFAEGDAHAVNVDVDALPELLGPERFFVERMRQILSPGVATGLAWTEAGGDVLYIEVTELPEGEKITLTGHLGEVMKESAMTANSYVVSHCRRLGIEKTFPAVHIHVPAGAIPKDGPSAGVTMVTALSSLYADKAVRSDTAMTGEITLSGLVLPVGGIKEKVLAARRAGIVRVILPRENGKDLLDLPGHVKDEMDFIFVDTIEDVLDAALPDCFAGLKRVK